MNHSSSMQKGFTLIELIVVIVILGILAATALPRFVNLGDDAARAAVAGVAGAVSSASALNYSRYQISTAQAQRLNGDTPCATLIANAQTGLAGGALPAGYNVQADATCTGQAAGNAVVCTIRTQQGGNNFDANAQIICTN